MFRARGTLASTKARLTIAHAAIGLAFLALVVPGFVYPYLYDDFDFLVRTLHFTPSILLPDPGTVFYRPVSRELYFGLLQWLSSQGPSLGHALNAATLLVACLLCARIGSFFLGPRGGILSGLFFAGCGQLPVLVSWVSGAQDALAIVFTLGALFFETRGKHFPALIVAGLAILSKETAVAALPSIALASWFLSADPKRSRRRLVDYLILVIFWGALHPGIHLLAQRGFRAGGIEYVGLDNPYWYNELARYVPLLLNVPPPGLRADWPVDLTGIAGIAGVLAVMAALLAPSREAATTPQGVSRAKFVLVAVLAAIGPLLLTTLVLRHWAPYYMAFPAMGVAWLLATCTDRLPTPATVVVVAMFVIAGVGVRGLVIDPGVPTERNMAPAAAALRRLEPQFRALAPTMPPGAQVLVASQVQGRASVHVHVYTFQVFRQWYRDPNIRAVRPELRLPGHAPEFLFWINRNLDVFQIDLQTLQPRSVTQPARFSEYQGVLRAYSRGLAESDEVSRAVRILLTMPEPSVEYRWWDRRLAASYLLAVGREEEGRRLLQGAPTLERNLTLRIVVEFLAQPTKVPRYDRATFGAFDLDYRDPADVAGVMELLAETKNPAAPRFAVRLLQLRPGDQRALALLRAYEHQTRSERITPAQPPT